MKKFYSLGLLCFLLFLSIKTYSQQRNTSEKYSTLTMLSAALDSNNTVLVVFVGAPAEEYIEAVLTHSIGWVVEKKKVKLEVGKNRIRFDLSLMAEGSYRLLLRNEENTWTVSKNIKK